MTEQTPPGNGVVCAKCERVNPHRRNVCESCGAHLHVVCHHCGYRNPRSHAHCEECGHKLHRSRAKRALRGVFGKHSNHVVLQVILVLAAILIGFLLIDFFASWRPPVPE